MIRIIRRRPAKEQLIESFKLSDRQAEAILNMRLRSKNWKSFNRKEFDDLTKEKLTKELLEDEKELYKNVGY